MHSLADLRAGKLAGVKRLNLSCELSEFPHEIFDLADSLETLNLTGNNLQSLPGDLHRLHRLQVLFCSDNQFSELPACIGHCENLRIIGFKANQIRHVPAAALPPQLHWLILTDNQIEQLPDELGDCLSLQKLMLAGNRLRELPASLAACQQLELLRISATHLTHIPQRLQKLPSLTWLAFAGNPLCPAQAPLSGQEIPWQQLLIQQPLGEGASGIIQQALWQTPDQPASPVAVKLYKGSITSDGSPLNEMAACIAAGKHRNLIDVQGRIPDHPQGQAGLVMQLIAPQFVNLAGPPSLDSCTRDIYPTDMRLSLSVALHMARGIASVTAHLHARGITHGDLYGHNILWEPEGDCLLGDFGAASFHPNIDQAQALERIETRAFGILLGELLERCDEPAPLEWLELQARCVQPDVSQRPEMSEVERILSTASFL